MKLSMSSVDSRSLFVSGGDAARAEVRTSSGFFGILILFILKNHKILTSHYTVTVYTGAHCVHGAKVLHFEIRLVWDHFLGEVSAQSIRSQRLMDRLSICWTFCSMPPT